MKLQEIYKNQLINNLKLFNVVLGLSTIGNPSIKEFLELSKKSYTNICRNKDNKRKAVSTIMELSSDIMVLSEDCSFYNIQLLDLSIYDRIDYLLDKVLKYSSSDKLTEFFNEDFLLTVGYLEIMENHLGDNVKQTLSYIVIRNFLVLCNLRLYRFAYYYAMFIKGQIFLSEGLNPRVEYSDLYKSELSLAIKKERNKFSKNIKKKITKNVKDAVNLVPGVNLDEKKDSNFIGESTVMPVSGSNMSVDSISNLSNKTVEEYRDKIYDNSISDKANELKKNISEASSKAIKTGADGVKEVGKSAYEGSKEFVKEHLEVPKPIVETIDKVKEGLGGESKAVNKSLGDLERSVNKVEPINSSNAFHGMDNVNNSSNPNQSASSCGSNDKPKKASSFEKLRNRRNSRMNMTSNNGGQVSNSRVVGNQASNIHAPNSSIINSQVPNNGVGYSYYGTPSNVNTNRVNPSTSNHSNSQTPSHTARVNPSHSDIGYSNRVNTSVNMTPNINMTPSRVNPSVDMNPSINSNSSNSHVSDSHAFSGVNKEVNKGVNKEFNKPIEITKKNVSKPVTSQRVVSQPVVNQPVATKPVTSQLAVNQPAVEKRPRRTYNGLSPKGVMRKMARPRTEMVSVENPVEEVKSNKNSRVEKPSNAEKSNPITQSPSNQSPSSNPSNQSPSSNSPSSNSPSSGTKVKAKIRMEKVVNKSNSNVSHEDSRIDVENGGNSEDSYVDSSDIKKSSFFS